MRLIDAEKLKRAIGFADAEVLYDKNGKYLAEAIAYIQDILDRQPTVEARPVIHGHWIEKKMPFDYVMCSACEIGVPFETDYCPSCGAKMDEGE